MQTEHGYNIIEYFQIENNDSLVLVERDAATHLHPYVVWRMNAYNMKCSEGDYCSTKEQAQKAFERRKKLFQ